MIGIKKEKIIGSTIYADTDISELLELSFLGKTIFIDFETDMSKDNYPVLLTLFLDDTVYIIVGEDMRLVFPKLKEAEVIVAHNAQFECSVIYKTCGILLRNWFCTMIAHQALYNDPIVGHKHSLEAIVYGFFKKKLNKSAQKTFKVDVELTTEQVNYAKEDVIYLPSIYYHLLEKLEENEQEVEMGLEMSILPELSRAFVIGIRIDEEQLDRNIAKWKEEIKIAKKDVEEEWKKFLPLQNPYKLDSPLNIDSSLQVGVLFQFAGYQSNVLSKQIKFTERYGEVPLLGKMPINKKETDTIDMKALEYWLEDLEEDCPLESFIEKYIKYKKLGKLQSTYGEGFKKWIKNGRIHSSYSQRLTNTARTSSSAPNIQNLPQLIEIRNMLIADEGFTFLVADFSGQEVLIAADKSLEPVLVNALVEGQDHHSFLSSKIYSVIFGQTIEVSNKKEPLIVVEGLEKTELYEPKQLRTDSKPGIFGFFYGGGTFRMKNIYIKYLKKHVLRSERDAIAGKISEIYKKNLPVLYAWLKSNIGIYEALGYITPSIIGRRIRFKENGYGEILNVPIQGTGADSLKLAIAYIADYIEAEIEKNPEIRDKVYYLFNVHDEIIIHIHKDYLYMVDTFVALMKKGLDDLLSDEGKALGLKAEIDYQLTEKYTK